MKYIVFIFSFFFLIFLFDTDVFAQKYKGFGGEVSTFSFKPGYRNWISKKSGFDLFGGVSAETEDIKPNDFEAGFKWLSTIRYNRVERLYIGIMGKWKWVNYFDENSRTNLPIYGLLIGKEWFSKHYHRKGIAVELGYQFGSKTYNTYYSINGIKIENNNPAKFQEFPLILNFRYTFYSKTKR
jgi:hypothetical protein